MYPMVSQHTANATFAAFQWTCLQGTGKTTTHYWIDLGKLFTPYHIFRNFCFQFSQVLRYAGM